MPSLLATARSTSPAMIFPPLSNANAHRRLTIEDFCLIHCGVFQRLTSTLFGALGLPGLIHKNLMLGIVLAAVQLPALGKVSIETESERRRCRSAEWRLPRRMGRWDRLARIRPVWDS